MSINQISAIALEKTIAKLLSLDAQAKSKLSPFEGKTIQLQITDLNLNYYLQFTSGEIRINESFPATEFSENQIDPAEVKVSAIISGKMSGFLAAAAAENSSDSIFKGELHFSGEINTAKQFQALAQSMDIDWQEPFAQILGDPLAHTLTSGIKKLSRWLVDTTKNSTQDVGEYLQEEIQATPSYAEQQMVFEQIDSLRSRTDRLQAKISHFKTVLNNNNQPRQEPNL
jgi:ubiquinone biosynthesis accessory factor UbiJ